MQQEVIVNHPYGTRMARKKKKKADGGYNSLLFYSKRKQSQNETKFCF